MEVDTTEEHPQGQDEGDELEEEHDLNETVLAVVWAAGKLGAAYYELETSELFLLPDTAEAAPDFEILRTLFKQVSPKVIIGCLRQDTRFLDVLKELSGDLCLVENESETSNQASSIRRRPSLFVEPGREFAPDSCKRRLQSLRLPDEPKTNGDYEHLFFITSLIPFSNITMVRAAGALLKFLDKRGIELLRVDLINGQTPVLNVKICTMDEIVLVDHTAWDSLQIFNKDAHPSAAKKGATGSKEGLSIYGLFTKCFTSQGSNYLRLQLLRPTRNMSILKRRHDVIQHCISLAHTGFVESASNRLKTIKNLPKLLLKLSLLHMTIKDWKALYQTLHNCTLLGELCSAQPPVIELFKDISEVCKIDTIVQSLVQEIRRVIDFDQSNIHQRFYPQVGLNDELDRKRQQYNVLPEVMSMIATEEMLTLPSYVEQCCIVYIPEVGYLLAIKLWAEGLTMENLMLEGLEYKFTSTDMAYYKSTRTKELDIVLGDSQVSILEFETYIMIALTENIMKNASGLVRVNTLISEFDSLMSMACVARDQKYVRPEIVEGHSKLRIVDGRHPLIQLTSDVVPNSTIFSEEEKIVILTGPNASGKSIYLKQVGTIVLMALCGSFIPATSAIIPLFDRICTRIYAQESVAVGLSTFMLDINQMSLSLRNTTQCSLVIVDEFGKGTSEADGLSLLQATLEHFGQKGVESPTIFISTHYYSLLHRLSQTPIFKAQTMDFILENDKLVYLFKLKDGTCNSSFAYIVAQGTGTPMKTVTRSLEIEKVLRHAQPEDSIKALPFQEKKEAVMLEIADQFIKMDLNNIDPEEYFREIQDLLDPFMAVECLPSHPPVETPDSLFSYLRSNDRSGQNTSTRTIVTSSTPSTTPTTRTSQKGTMN